MRQQTQNSAGVDRRPGEISLGQSDDEGGDPVDTELVSPEEQFPLHMHWRPNQRQSYEEVVQRKEDQWRQALPGIKDSVISRAPYTAGHRRQQHKINQQKIEHVISHALSIGCRFCPGASLTLISHREVECWTLADYHRVQLLTMACPCGCFGMSCRPCTSASLGTHLRSRR